jgi:hypothetical protein
MFPRGVKSVLKKRMYSLLCGVGATFIVDDSALCSWVLELEKLKMVAFAAAFAVWTKFSHTKTQINA